MDGTCRNILHVYEKCRDEETEGVASVANIMKLILLRSLRIIQGRRVQRTL